MIHVLLEERLYDEHFVRDWTNGAFLLREDTAQMLTGQDLAPAGDPQSSLAWDSRGGARWSTAPTAGTVRTGLEPALSGTYTVTLASGKPVTCRPALELLRELAARYTPERSEAMTWVPAGEVRRAVRLFATERPSCYYTWVGLEQRVDAMQTNRAVGLFYALTGQFDQRGSNVLFASTPVNPIMGLELLPREAGVPSPRLCRAPAGPAGRSRPGASARRVSRHPHRAPLPGEGPDSVRD